MLAYALVAGGAVLSLLTLVIARRTRTQGIEHAVTDDPFGAYAPLTTEEIERDARVRLWPVIGVLTGLTLLTAGLVVARRASLVTPAITPRPYVLAIESPTPEPSVTPGLTPSAEPSASALAGSASPRVTARATATPKRSTPKPPTARPTPTPPPRPGPNISANTSCFGSGGTRSASISYNLTARQGTKLKTSRLSLDGRVVRNDSVSGKNSYSNSYSTTVSKGTHTFTVTTTASDGGATTRNYNVTCP